MKNVHCITSTSNENIEKQHCVAVVRLAKATLITTYTGCIEFISFCALLYDQCIIILVLTCMTFFLFVWVNLNTVTNAKLRVSQFSKVTVQV